MTCHLLGPGIEIEKSGHMGQYSSGFQLLFFTVLRRQRPAHFVYGTKLVREKGNTFKRAPTHLVECLLRFALCDGICDSQSDLWNFLYSQKKPIKRESTFVVRFALTDSKIEQTMRLEKNCAFFGLTGGWPPRFQTIAASSLG